MATRRHRNKKLSRKRRHSRKNRYFSKKAKKYNKKLSRKNKKGGFGKGSCPFITPPPAWNATGYSYFFPLSKNGVAPGGVPVFPGNTRLSKQNGGNLITSITPQFMLNSSRVATTGVGNIVNRFKGKHLDPSPLPMYDQLNPRTLRRKGL
tara:strand:- start:263 stop:712 length:450 start_codon:yes stop_codon:yes gene_type:complete